MSFEDRMAIGLLAVVFVGVSAAGFAIGGSSPTLNVGALLIGAGFWWLATRNA